MDVDPLCRLLQLISPNELAIDANCVLMFAERFLMVVPLIPLIFFACLLFFPGFLKPSTPGAVRPACVFEILDPRSQ